MSTRRITLTLPEALIESAEVAVAAGRARSVSAYVAEVAGAGEARLTLDEVMARWSADSEHTASEQQTADEWARQFMVRNDSRYAERATRAGGRAG
jgi:hypothetical protein